MCGVISANASFQIYNTLFHQISRSDCFMVIISGVGDTEIGCVGQSNVNLNKNTLVQDNWVPQVLSERVILWVDRFVDTVNMEAPSLILLCGGVNQKPPVKALKYSSNLLLIATHCSDLLLLNLLEFDWNVLPYIEHEAQWELGCWSGLPFLFIYSVCLMNLPIPRKSLAVFTFNCKWIKPGQIHVFGHKQLLALGHVEAWDITESRSCISMLTRLNLHCQIQDHGNLQLKIRH